MRARISLDAAILLFSNWRANNLQYVVVRDIAKQRSVRLVGYDNFEPMDLSRDGERVALFRGKHWQGHKNEIVVIAWRTGERLFTRTEQP